MPIYEYRCTSCGHQFDLMQKMNASTTQKCEQCGKKAQRLISQSSFMLKGTGWYATDYAGKKPAANDSASPCAAGACGTGACPNAS